MKVFIVEDDAIIARDIQLILEGLGYAVIGMAYSGFQAIELLRTLKPDLALLDINLGGGLSGLDVARHLHSQGQTPFIFLTSYADRDTLQKARELHPVGYVVKPFEEHDLLAAIEIGTANYARQNNLSAISMEMLNRHLPTPLTQREFEMLMDICDGKQNQEMADAHFVSLNTVKTHVKRIFEKLDVHSRPEAMVRIRELQEKK
jgi:DNA-binding NarL/FixJ family response regulator